MAGHGNYSDFELQILSRPNTVHFGRASALEGIVLVGAVPHRLARPRSGSALMAATRVALREWRSCDRAYFAVGEAVLLASGDLLLGLAEALSTDDFEAALPQGPGLVRIELHRSGQIAYELVIGARTVSIQQRAKTASASSRAS